MDSPKDSYLVFKDYLKLASNSMIYSLFFIYSPLLFTAESRYSTFCLIQMIVTLCIVLAGCHYLLELCAETLACHLIRRVDTSRIVYYGKSQQMKQKWTLHVEYCSPRTFWKSQKYGLSKAQFLTPRCHWQRGVDFFYIILVQITPRNPTNFKIAFRHVYWDQDKPFNERKGIKKSRWTVPFMGKGEASAILYVNHKK